MSNFSTASKVQSTIIAGDNVRFIQGANRKKILDAANCVPPLDKAFCKKNNIRVNVNWGEMATILTHVVSQMLSAFTANQYYFTVTLPRAPKEHQADWGSFITNEINQIIQESIEYYLLHCSRWSSVAKYGVGPMTWRRDDRWRPKFCPLADLIIPTDTTLDFENLNWYAQRVPYTVVELIDEAFNRPAANNGWKKKLVADILKNYKEQNFVDATQNINWDVDLEKLASIIKQNGGFYGSNALPTIPLNHFYFEDSTTDNRKQWFMRVVPDNSVVKGGTDDDFLWTSTKPVANSWKELLHCQFGDLSFDDPPTFGAVRGPGFMLLEPTFYSNLTRCRAVQHLNDQMNIWLRVTDPADKARPSLQEFSNMGVLRSGISVVPQTERHQIQSDLLEFVTAQMKQLQGEASSSYTQQADTGTQKEQTAFETRVKAEQVNAMTSGIILKATKFEDQANREICRRFCLNSQNPALLTDPDIIKFQARCRRAGIPAEWLDINQWIVQTVTPIGMGNPTIAQAAIQQLQAIAPKLSQQAQNEINHESVLVLTKDPRKAARWAPVDEKPTQSDATREAVGLFATLLIAAPGSVPPPQNNYIDQIEVLLPLLAGKIAQYTKRNNMATQDEAMGLGNALQYIGQAVQALGQDPAQKQRVKKYTDDLAKLGNEVKALTQRGEQAAQAQAKQAQAGQNGEAAAKMKADQAMTAQKIHHKEIEFNADQARKDRAARAEQRRKDADTYASIEHDRFGAMAGAHNARFKSLQETPE